MKTQISDEQRQALQEAQNVGPIVLVDPATNATYYLVSANLYERLQALMTDEPFDVRETYAAQDAALAKVWNEPELDAYNEYDQHRTGQ